MNKSAHGGEGLGGSGEASRRERVVCLGVGVGVEAGGEGGEGVGVSDGFVGYALDAGSRLRGSNGMQVEF